MISAEQLYRKIKEKYPDFRPPKATGRQEFDIPPSQITPQMIELMEKGFKIKLPQQETH